MKTEFTVKQFRDTNYYLNADGNVYHKLKDRYARIQGCVDKKGACKRIRVKVGNKNLYLSRMMWETFNGEIPEGYIVEHRNGCSTMNDLLNLNLVKINDSKRFKVAKSKKIINLQTKEIYKGTREAAASLKHCRKTIRKICGGKKLPKVQLDIAYWDDVNGKAFRGNYDKYYNKYMKEDMEYES